MILTFAFLSLALFIVYFIGRVTGLRRGWEQGFELARWYQQAEPQIKAALRVEHQREAAREGRQ